MKLKLLFEPRDIWIGVYVGKPACSYYLANEMTRHIYICLIPMIVLRFAFTWLE